MKALLNSHQMKLLSFPFEAPKEAHTYMWKKVRKITCSNANNEDAMYLIDLGVSFLI